MEEQKNHRSVVKWVGGKLRLVNHIRRLLPPGQQLIEPFAGSGAVFLNTQFSRYILNDCNHDLINLYCHIRDEGLVFIHYVKKFFIAKNNIKERYYELRETFNQCTNLRRRAALFLYLNRHGYNGLCRYNSQGGYNVPFGSYRKPYFPAEELQHFYQQAQSVDFHCGDFRDVMKTAKKGDVIYADPPYVPLSESANFTQYHRLGFNEEDHKDLATLAEALQQRGVSILISNHDTAFTRKIYHQAKLTMIEVPRLLGCNPDMRGRVSELFALYQPITREAAPLGKARGG